MTESSTGPDPTVEASNPDPTEVGSNTVGRHYATTFAAMPAGTAITVKAEGFGPFALFRTEDGHFFATSDTCTHEKWSLGEDSDLEGAEVVCPLHMARFDIRTGRALCFPATEPLATYRVDVDADGSVYILA